MTLDPGGFGWWLGTGKDATAGCGRGCEQPLLVLIALLEVPETAERWDLGLNTSCGRWAMTTTSISPSKRTEIDISGRSFRVCKKRTRPRLITFFFSELIKQKENWQSTKNDRILAFMLLFWFFQNNRVTLKCQQNNLSFNSVSHSVSCLTPKS